MKFTLYFDIKRKILRLVNFIYDNEIHNTCDIRITSDKDTEACICFSGSTIKNLDFDVDDMVKYNLYSKKEIVIESPNIEINQHGISYILINHSQIAF